MKQVEEATDRCRKELRDRIVHTLTEARDIGIDPDQLVEEAKRVDHKWEVEAARGQINQALWELKAATRKLADAYENELIDPASLSETWPEWMPAIEEVAADVEGIEPLEEMPK